MLIDAGRDKRFFRYHAIFAGFLTSREILILAQTPTATTPAMFLTILPTTMMIRHDAIIILKMR